jgi:hypothetical protein
MHFLQDNPRQLHLGNSAFEFTLSGNTRTKSRTIPNGAFPKSHCAREIQGNTNRCGEMPAPDIHNSEIAPR